MKKCCKLSQDLLKDYNEKVRGIRSPKLICVKAGHSKSESFELSYAGGAIRIATQNSLAEAFALGLLNTVVPSGHWHEYLGVSHPKYSLRPIWLRMPGDDDSAFHAICRRAVALGYNSIAWSGRENFWSIPREYGLKTITVLSECNHEMISKITADYIFFEGKLPLQNEKETLAESIAGQIRLLESMLPTGTELIYFVPCNTALSAQRSAQVILDLCNETSPGTCLAFSAVAGDPTGDHLPLHPIWEMLRKLPSIAGTGLLPIFNIGGIEQGEGFWPSFCFEQVELLASHCKRHSFAGCISLAQTMPGEGGFSHASLWVAGQTMWRDTNPSLLLETWLKAYKNDVNSDMSITVLRKARQLIIVLNRFKHEIKNPQSVEDQRLIVEEVQLHLRRLERILSEIEKSRPGKIAQLSLYDYLAFFLRDAKRIFKCFLPSANVEDDAQESIWTKNLTVGNSRKSILLEQPNPGTSNSKLALIFTENRCL